MKEIKTPDLSTTISESIYTHLKKAIIEGNLKPNQRIQEKEIAELFQVSTTPVREAFRRLSAEKFLVINAHKEVLVTSVTVDEIQELFEVARNLDVLAVKKAIDNLPDKEIEELRKMTEKLGNWYRKKNFPAYAKLNLKIHDKIWRFCGNKFLYQSLINLGEKFSFYGNQMFFYADTENNPSAFDLSYQDHLDLMAAIEKRDKRAVETVLSTHWGKGFLDEEGNL